MRKNDTTLNKLNSRYYITRPDCDQKPEKNEIWRNKYKQQLLR